MFYIEKKPNGVPVWLKRLGPAVVWGPKELAMKFPTLGTARMMLARVPKTDEARVVSDEEPAV